MCLLDFVIKEINTHDNTSSTIQDDKRIMYDQFHMGGATIQFRQPSMKRHFKSIPLLLILSCCCLVEVHCNGVSNLD